MRRKKNTGSFPETNGWYGYSFREFLEEVVFFQALSFLVISQVKVQ